MINLKPVDILESSMFDVIVPYQDQDPNWPPSSPLLMLAKS